MKTITTLRLLLIISIITVFSTESLAQYYTLAKSSGNYQKLSSPTQIEMPWNNTEDNYARLNIGNETFKFFNVDYSFSEQNPVYVSTAGNLKFYNDNSAIILDGFFTWLGRVDSVLPKKAAVSYQWEDISGDRVLKIEYRDMPFPYCDEDAYYVNFQIWMFQTSGNIEVHYGPVSAGCDSVYLGGTGPYVGIFQSNKDFSSISRVFWLYGSPENPSVTNTALPSLTGTPTNGLIYKMVTPQSTSVPESGQGSLRIYPNPVEDRLMYELPGDEDGGVQTVRILSLTGSVLREEHHPAGAHSVDVAGLAQGVYYLEIRGVLSRSLLKFVKY